MPRTIASFRQASPLRIGLLGGSFNPAHSGHVAISLDMMKRYKLDYVWWIVSASNPLKDPASLHEFQMRYRSACNLTSHVKRIMVTDIENHRGLRYSADVIRHIVSSYACHQFVWLMGADNMQSFHRWQEWNAIAAQVPIIIYDRSPFSHTSCRSVFAHTYSAARRPMGAAAVACAPSWSFAFGRKHMISATMLRKAFGKDAFTLYN